MQIDLPKVVFGSSALGNLYEVVPEPTKLAIVENWMRDHDGVVVIDSAGKYGAGLALESIGRCLKELKVSPENVLISNKLGWKRAPLTTPEPTFEQGVWFGLEHDAVQQMGYDGIIECYEQGNELLGDYTSELLSVHDPDEYLACATDAADAEARYQEILESYRALVDLRHAGKAKGIGVGSKDWSIIKRLYDDGVSLDWVMFANSYTLYSHPVEVAAFMTELVDAGVSVINSAVFNAGFLIGGKFFNYQVLERDAHPELFDWRDRFLALCKVYDLKPAHVCCQFGLSVPGTAALALNSSQPERVPHNVQYANEPVPAGFWQALKDEDLLEADYPYL